MLKKTFLNNVFEYVLILCIVLQCNSLIVVSSGTLRKFFNLFTLMLILVLFIISIIRIIGSQKNKIGIRKLFLFSIFLALYSFDFVIIEYFFVYKFNALTILLFLLSPIAFVTYFFERKLNDDSDYSFLKKLVYVVFILELISLIGWILILSGVRTNVTFFSQWSKQNVSGYYYLDFITQHNSLLGINNIARNTGLFAEAPMYAYVLSLSLIIQSFVIKDKSSRFNKINFGVTLLTIITTLSTTGIIISIIVLMVKAFLIVSTKYTNKVRNTLLSLLVLISSVSAIKIYLNKKTTSSGYYSSLVRYDDIFSCIKSWLDHFIWGVGINNNEYISRYVLPYRRNGLGLSTGFFSALAFGGIILALFYLIPMIMTLFYSRRLLLISFILLILFIYTIISFTYLFSLMLSYLWFEILFCKKGENSYELFSSWIRTVWSNIRSRSSKKG